MQRTIASGCGSTAPAPSAGLMAACGRRGRRPTRTPWWVERRALAAVACPPAWRCAGLGTGALCCLLNPTVPCPLCPARRAGQPAAVGAAGAALPHARRRPVLRAHGRLAAPRAGCAARAARSIPGAHRAGPGNQRYRVGGQGGRAELLPVKASAKLCVGSRECPHLSPVSPSRALPILPLQGVGGRGARPGAAHAGPAARLQQLLPRRRGGSVPAQARPAAVRREPSCPPAHACSTEAPGGCS